MRNLKRVLSLALATAMLFSMMVIGASAANKTAADLTDMDKVNHKEAVSLMVDLGIIVGKPDGSFAPTETIDRATMSKLIYFIMMGNTDESAFKGVSTPLTDVKGNWAEGFINYCYSVNIVAGTGNNTYNPGGKVTTVSAAKMLLVALGYDPVASKYQNDTLWSVNIMRDAQSAGLLKNIDQKASENLTRDNAAQMIYNALFANTVKPSFQIDMGIKYLNGYTPARDAANNIIILAESNYNLKKVTGTVLANDFSNLDAAAAPKEGKTIVNVTAGPVTLDIASGADVLGHEVYYFVNKNTDKVISTSLFETGETKVHSTTWSATSKDNTDYITNNNLSLTVATKYSENFEKVAGATTPSAGDTVVYINSDGKGAVEYRVVTTYQFGVVTDVNTSKGTFRISGTKALPIQEVSKVSGAENLKKGDFVTYHQVGGSYVFAKADSVVGTVSAVKTASGKTTATIDGKGYEVATDVDGVTISGVAGAQTAKAYIAGIDLKKATEGTFYLNKLGKVAIYVGDAAEADAQYALVTALKVSTDAWDGKKTVEAKIVLADGIQKTVTLADVANATVPAGDAGAGYPVTKRNLTNSLYDLAVAGGITPNTDLAGKVYAYTVDSKDNYKFSIAAAQVGAVTLNGANDAVASIADISAGVKVLGATTNLTGVSYTTGGKAEIKAATVYANDKTTVLFYDATDANNIKVKSYTGVSNIPSFGATTVIDYIPGANGSLYTPFILVKASPAGDSSTKNYAYALSNDYTVTANGHVYDFVVDGEKVSLTLDAGDSAVKDELYSYTTTDGITKLGTGDADLLTGTVTNVTSEYAIIKLAGGSNTMYYLADAAISDLTSFKDGKLVVAAGALSVGDTVKFAAKTVNSDKYVAAAYIVPGAFDASATGNELTATGTKVGTTYTVTAATDVTLDSGYKFAYTWKVGGVAQSETSNTFTNAGVVTCEVTIVSRLDGSVCGMTDDTLSADKIVTVSSFS